MSDGGEEVSPFTQRLRRLFASIPDPETGRLFTYAEAARRINARAQELPESQQAGRKISNTYVWQLAEGQRTNPTKRHMESLADLFGVPVSFLLDDAPNPALEAELEVAAAMRKAGVSELAHRARGLSPGALRSVLSMIDHVRELEGLPTETNQGEAQGAAG